MYLEKFIIKNFRAIEELELNFNKGLNILIGENNSGKTAIIDALRLCLGDFEQPRDIYCSKSDFRIDKSELNKEIENIEFHLFFKCDDIKETAWFNELHVLSEEEEDNLQLHFRFELIDHKLGKKVKRTVWGGEKEGGKVSYEVLSALRNVYLSALRDPHRNLRPNKQNILGNLYSNIILDEDKELNQKEKEKLLEKITNVLDKDWDEFIKKGNKWISEHLEQLSYSTAEKKQNVKIGFTSLEFDRFIQNLIIQLPIFSKDLIENPNEQKYFEIWQNGLGLNNLIYTAAVLGDIKQRKSISEEEYTLLLIEEPEAHLHPQLQNTFFNYLKKLDENDEFQIIVTSHSPTIAAKTDLNLLTILQNNHNNVHSTPIKDIKLEEDSLKYLQKFLDVTKSQLFFSNGVILVEGISESLLIPIFSRIVGKDYDLERNGIEVVNINGVAFKHFAQLFKSTDEKIRLQCHCAIITDNDEDKRSESVRARVKSIEELEDENLKVKLARKTFEHELFVNNSDNECLLNIIKELHPQKFTEINDSSKDIDKRADILVTTLSNSQNKSEFAYLLAIELEKDQNFYDFNVPPYIEEAIEFVVDGPSV